MRGRDGVGILVLCVLTAACGCDDRRGRRSSGTPAPGASASGGSQTPRMAAPSPPKAAAMAWGDAVDAGDFPGAKALSVGTPEQFKTLEAICAERAASRAFDAAVDAKMPDELTGIAIQGLATTLQYADEFPEGDAVTFHIYIDNTPITVRKQPDGAWRVSLEKFTSDMEATARTVAGAYEKLRQEVNAGKYADRTKALDALGPKMREAAAELGVELSAKPLADDAAAGATAPPPTPAAPAAPAAPPVPAAPAEGDGFE